MRVNTKLRLAVNSMIDLALREQAGPVVLAAVASRQQVSLSCLEQLFKRLRRAGLVRSTRGNGGGYSLGREAAAISVAAIVDAVGNGGAGADEGVGLVNDLSRRLDAVMQTYMAGITLAELVAGQRDPDAMVQLSPRRAAAAPRSQARAVSANAPNSVFELGTVIARPTASPGGRKSAAWR